MTRIFLILGSNIDPEKNIPLAQELLRKTPGVKLKKASACWRTKPIGSCCNEFLNAAVLLETELEPKTLKNEVLIEIESALGRVRTKDKNAPRTIDLDIVAVNDTIIDPDVEKFDHALLPLAEIAPDLRLPGQDLTLALSASMRRQRTSAIRVD